MNQEKLLAWIEMRLNDHKEKKKVIWDREFSEPFDQKTHAYHVGASAELVFLRECIVKHKAFDLPQASNSTERPSEAVAESEVYGNDCRNGQC